MTKAGVFLINSEDRSVDLGQFLRISKLNPTHVTYVSVYLSLPEIPQIYPRWLGHLTGLAWMVRSALSYTAKPQQTRSLLTLRLLTSGLVHL